MLVHSPLVGPTSWSPVASELGRRGRSAVVPSLRGVPVQHLAQVTDPVAVTDALLHLEAELVERT